MLYIYTKNSLPGVHFNNLFPELQLPVLFNYFFTTLSPAVRCFDGFCMHAKEKGFTKNRSIRPGNGRKIMCIQAYFCLFQKKIGAIVAPSVASKSTKK